MTNEFKRCVLAAMATIVSEHLNVKHRFVHSNIEDFVVFQTSNQAKELEAGHGLVSPICYLEWYHDELLAHCDNGACSVDPADPNSIDTISEFVAKVYP